METTETPTETPARVVLHEAAHLSALRGIIENAVGRIQTQSHAVTDPDEARGLGQLIESLKAADNALFHALVIAKVHADCAAATAVLARELGE